MKTGESQPQLKYSIFGRLLVVLGFCLLWAIVIIGRLVFLQVFQATEYDLQAQCQQWGFVELNPKRGDILDRNFEQLATSVRADSIYAHPDQVRDPIGAAKALTTILGKPTEEIFKCLTSDAKFVYLKRKVAPRIANQVRELGFSGIYSRAETKRIYPNRELAGHVLGFVGVDNLGLGGIEYHFCDQLRGEEGRVDLRFDARRNSFNRRPTRAQIEGNVLVLSLDSTIQHVAETVLEQTVEEKGAASGSAVLMNPHSGEILAMASYPRFNPNDFSSHPDRLRRNRAILDIYEPGSTFKVITLASLLNEGLADPEEVIDCHAGTARIAGKVYREAKTNYGFLTVSQVIAKSSNIGTVKLALRIGEERLHDYISRFGFGQKTGIDLPGEESGLFRPTSQWSKISIGALSIGQEIAATPLQVIRAVATLANGGYLVKPYIVQRVLTPEGDLIAETKVERRRILQPETIDTAKAILQTVVEEGTGKTSILKGYSSAGKTGTAQKIVDGKYSRSKYVASFVGFAPADDPALIGLVVINEPKGIAYGGYVAGPAFKEIMERALIRMRVHQDRPADVSPSDPQDRRYLLAGTKASNREQNALKDIPIPEETILADNLKETVLTLIEDSSDEGDGQTPIITVSLGTRTLPDLTGLSLREVAQICAKLNLKLKISGSGIAVGQRPAPGKRLTKGMVCEVYFSNERKPHSASTRVAISNLDESVN